MTASPVQITSPHRIEVIDIGRGLALLAMAIYHFAWDLEFFGYLPPAMTGTGGWKLFARGIASSFLFLVGFSLFLAHGNGIRWKGFWKRLAMVAGAALCISIVTYIAVPNGFIFFGILHQIALASVLGLAFVRLPATVVLLAGVSIIAAPFYLRSEIFDAPWWWWSGLSQAYPRSNDYVPVFPWFGVVLLGIVAAKVATSTGALARLGKLKVPHWLWPLSFTGQHSLAFYLIHQPVLIACVWLLSQVSPPPQQSRETLFLQSCERTCGEQRDTKFCLSYCVCVLDGLQSDGTIERFYAGEQSTELSRRAEETAGMCTVLTESASSEQEGS